MCSMEEERGKGRKRDIDHSLPNGIECAWQHRAGGAQEHGLVILPTGSKENNISVWEYSNNFLPFAVQLDCVGSLHSCQNLAVAKQKQSGVMFSDNIFSVVI